MKELIANIKKQIRDSVSDSGPTVRHTCTECSRTFDSQHGLKVHKGHQHRRGNDGSNR